jgi:lysophospholipase L1-like esterase
LSSDKTTNLALHKWAGTDPVERTEFNDNFGTIDAKIGDHDIYKADKIYVDTQLAKVNGGPKGSYATLTALQAAFPSGDEHNYIVAADNKWYYWNSAAWVVGGVYQAAVIPQKSQSIEILSVSKVGKNLFDKSRVVADTDITSTGVKFTRVGYSATTYDIETSGNTTYAFTKVATVAWYDSNKVFIIRNTATINTLFTSPANAAFMQVGAATTDLGAVQIEVGTKFTSYEPFKYIIPKGSIEKQDLDPLNDLPDASIAPQKVSFFEESLNKYNPSDSSVRDGYYYSNTTGYQSSATYTSFTLLKIKSGDVLTASNSMRYVTFVNGATGANNTSIQSVTTATAPFDGYVVISFAQSVKATFMVTVNASLPTSYQAYSWTVKKENLPKQDNPNLTVEQLAFTVPSINLANPNDANVLVQSYFGTPNTNYDTTGYMKVLSGKTYNFGVKAREIRSFDNFLTQVTAETVSDVYQFTATHDGYIRAAVYGRIQNCIVTTVANPSFQSYGSKIPDDLLTVPDFKAFLPKEICVAVGRTIELYNKQVCVYADRYYFEWICNVGANLTRKFSITGTSANIGEYSLKLNIRDKNNNVVWFGTTTVKIVNNVITAPITVCPIGDSLTNSKPWLAETRTLSGNMIKYVGTRWNGDTQGGNLNHEGRSGWSYGSYMSNATYTFDNNGVSSANPFWNPTTSRFDWNYYKSTSGLNPSTVQIFLGTNSLPDYTSDFTTNAAAVGIKQVVDYIRQDDANIPIFVVNTLYRPSQNGIGNTVNTDGYSDAQNKYKLKEDMKIFGLMKSLSILLDSYTKVYFMPIALAHDSEFNFGQQNVAVNPRNSGVTEVYPIDSVHPQTPGYLQMADIMYSTICAHQ